MVRDKELDIQGDMTPASKGLARLPHRALGPGACLRCERPLSPAGTGF